MTASDIAPIGSQSGVDASIVMGWCGPDEHGIARFGRQVACAAITLGFGGAVLHEVQPDRLIDLVDRLPARTRLLHLQVNDWLFADADVDVDRTIATLADRVRRRRVALAVTLHDIPQLSDGRALYQRRCNTYRLLVASAVGVVVSSEHERLLLREALTDTAVLVPSVPARPPWGSPVEVIPLPIDSLVPTRVSPTQEHRSQPGNWAQPTIGIFGYLYPGKGHREVVEEITGMDPAPAVLAVGRTSDRHTELLDELTEVAARRGIEFHCTGYVPNAELAGRLRAVTVPVAPHTHISASASINSWLAVGRRPLVPAGRYVEELEQRMPGSMWIYQPGELRGNLEMAVTHPEMTWLPEDLVVGPSTPTVAERYVEWLRLRANALGIG